jgi:hypothetical protein
MALRLTGDPIPGKGSNGRWLCPFTLYEALPLNVLDGHQMSVSGEVELPRVMRTRLYRKKSQAAAMTP